MESVEQEEFDRNWILSTTQLTWMKKNRSLDNDEASCSKNGSNSKKKSKNCFWWFELVGQKELKVYPTMLAPSMESLNRSPHFFPLLCDYFLFHMNIIHPKISLNGEYKANPLIKSRSYPMLGTILSHFEHFSQQIWF